MKLPSPSDVSVRARESGTIIVILLILIALFTVITIGSSYSLSRLRKEVLSLEHRHAARVAVDGSTNLLHHPAQLPEVPAAQSPVSSKPDAPAR